MCSGLGKMYHFANTYCKLTANMVKTFGTNRVIKARPSSSLQIIFSEAMLQNIQKCTISEAQRITGNINWNVTLQELDKFIGLIITKGV